MMKNILLIIIVIFGLSQIPFMAKETIKSWNWEKEHKYQDGWRHIGFVWWKK